MIKFIILIFSFCSLGFSKNSNDKIIIKEGVGLENTIVLGEMKKNIRKRFGRPDPFLYTKYKKMASTHPHNRKSAKSVTIQKVGRPRDTYFYKNLELQISFSEDNLASSIYIITDKYQTSKGLSIGDSREKAYKLYREGDTCQPILQVSKEGGLIFILTVVALLSK